MVTTTIGDLEHDVRKSIVLTVYAHHGQGADVGDKHLDTRCMKFCSFCSVKDLFALNRGVAAQGNTGRNDELCGLCV
eukprot:368931-Rhodomonas_salina.2